MKLIDTRLGRRWTVGGSIAIAGISLCLVAVVPKGVISFSFRDKIEFVLIQKIVMEYAQLLEEFVILVLQTIWYLKNAVKS